MGITGTALDELAWGICLLASQSNNPLQWQDALVIRDDVRVEAGSEKATTSRFQGGKEPAWCVPSGTPPERCEECAGAFALSKPPPFIMDMSQRWLCAGCCLREDADANPFQFMKGNLEQVWLSQAMLFAAEGSPAGRHGEAHCGPPFGRQPVLVVWDPDDRECRVVAGALAHAFGGSCRFVDSRDRAAVQEALQHHQGIPLGDLCRPGTMAGVFPSGCWTSDCQRHPKVLLYELKYLRVVRLPDPERLRAVKMKYQEPLQAVRQALDGSAQWWLDPRALALISSALEHEKYAVVDGFLQDHEWRAIRAEVLRIDLAGQMEPGRKKGTNHLTDDEADLMNRNDRPYRWTMLDDNIAYCGDADSRAPGIGRYDTPARDALVTALRAGGDHVRPAVSARLSRVDLREKSMVTVYRASTRGRYQQHVDSHDAKFRRLSTLLYFNEGWEPGHGGENRLFVEGALSTQVKADTAPLANRLLLFWAEEDCPHEVLHTLKDRYASTVWYADADFLVGDMLGNPFGMKDRLAEDHMKIVGHLQTAFPVAPLTFAGAMVRAGVPSEEAHRLHAIHAFLAYDRRPPHWVAWDDAKSALEGTDPRVKDLLPQVPEV
mmetsp:Transcript_72542/g.200050  ORF Transcript_72542/g.200050 Transcript_72542/m.200050 type:complete len:605 (-) Transcript_72542:353-2167(-)